MIENMNLGVKEKFKICMDLGGKKFFLGESGTSYEANMIFFSFKNEIPLFFEIYGLNSFSTKLKLIKT